MSQVCLQCNRAALRRSSRRGFAENFVYSLLGYYPWRCGYCKERTMLRDRGADGERVKDRQHPAKR